MENSKDLNYGASDLQRHSPLKPEPPRIPQQPATAKLPTKRRGEVAEAAFLHKAASLGFSVAKPWGESDRYDFMVDCGTRIWRVQVKSAHSSALNGYSFHACGNVRKNRYTRRDIDFIVGYVVPDDVWYVIPIEAYGERTTIKVFPSSRRRMSRFEMYRDAWHYFGEPGTATHPQRQNRKPTSQITRRARLSEACPERSRRVPPTAKIDRTRRRSAHHILS